MQAWQSALALAGLFSLTGCDPRTLFYFLQPFEPTVPAPGPASMPQAPLRALQAANGLVIAPQNVESSQMECFAAMTTVALVIAPAH